MSVSLYSIAKKLPLLRGFTHDVSPYFSGSLLENRLGSQVFRTVGKHLAWQLRKGETPATVESFVDVLKRDGVLAIPEFLPREHFNEILQEVDSAQLGFRFRPFRDAEGCKLSVATIQVSADGDEFAAVRKHLQRNPLILALVSAIIRRPNNSPPSISITTYRCDDPAALDNDIENVLHADLHASTVKVFYYLNDIDESNGAFVYAKGSHRFSMNRLRHEYDISVRNAKLSKNGSNASQDLVAVRGIHRRPVIAPRHQKRLNLHETHLCGKANTLVITNNMGFHRRGEFTNGNPRKTILINFRHLERCF